MKAGRIKILFVHHSAGWGGAPASMIKLISSLDPGKFESEVLLIKDSVISGKLAEKGIKYSTAASVFYRKYYQFFPHSEAGYIHWFQVIRFSRLSVLWLMSRFYFAGRELSRFDFDVVHLNSSVLTDWLLPAKKRGRTVFHVREPFRKGKLDLLNRFFRTVINRNADQVIAISEDNSGRINLPGKTVVIYNFTEIPSTEPDPVTYSSGKVLYLGGSGTSKGFFTLVDALDLLNRDVKICFSGYYTEAQKPKTLPGYIKFNLTNGRRRFESISKIRNHPNALFIGPVDTPDILLDEVCCLVSPFTVPHFSRPVIEAHMHRKPAIGTDVEGMGEIIADGVNGLLVAKNDPEALAEAINMLTTHAQIAQVYGEEGYKTAVRKYTPRNIRQIEAIYSKIITT